MDGTKNGRKREGKRGKEGKMKGKNVLYRTKMKESIGSFLLKSCNEPLCEGPDCDPRGIDLRGLYTDAP